MARLRELRHGLKVVDLMPGVDGATRCVGAVEGFDLAARHYMRWKLPDRYEIPREVLRGLPPHGVYAACAGLQAIADAGLTIEDLEDGETALFCASAGSPYLMRQYLNEMHETDRLRGAPFGVLSTVSGTLNFNLGAFFRIRGGNCGFVSACSSSTHALGYALDEIRLGRHKRVIVIGAEEDNGDALLPFAGMRVLSEKLDPEEASCPFDSARNGFVGCGGAAALVLEAPEVALKRGAPVYAEVLGWAQTADGYSPAMPEPGGHGLARAMRKALKDARVDAADIDYINAHATSTVQGDRAEALAIREVFRTHKPTVSSTKALTGHGLSMAGAQETAFCALAISESFTPGCAHLRQPDEEAQGLNLPRESLDIGPRYVLKNSSGFGGSNVSLVLRRPE